MNAKETPAALRHMFKYFEEMLEVKERISENNSQLTGINFLELEALEMDVKLIFNDYFVVTVMHHPFNWVHWNEQYSYNINDTDENANKLKRLLSFTSLFLSGHEHIPHGASEQKFFDNTLHLKGGCFLFDKQHMGSNFEYSWFSILRIDTSKMLLEQQKHVYENKRERWIPQLRDREFLQKNRFRLTEEKKKRILDLLKKGSTSTIFNYLRARQIIVEETSADFAEVLIENRNFRLFNFMRGGKLEYILFPIRPRFYHNINSKKSVDFLDVLIKKHRLKSLVFRFLVLDLFVDENLSKLYLDPNTKRNDIRDFIIKRGDILFDNFRHNYFVRFEETLKNGKVLPKSFDLYKDLKFINHIIPFWEFEKHWV